MNCSNADLASMFATARFNGGDGRSVKDKGPRTVSYSICPNFDSLWLAQCIADNYSFVLKSNPNI